jgi:N-glycosylase/DNA lyase
MSMDKAQVIPVDTHVQQIAVKHYGFRKGASGGKVNMTPQLYSDVNEKLAAIWGPYAGWAHSVGLNHPTSLTFHHQCTGIVYG